MKTKSVPSGWLLRGGRRLDCGPYMSGALEARVRLDRLRVRKDPLSGLTAGHKGGIYNGPQFRRNYVDSRRYGVPFLTGGDVLQADLSRLPLLSRKDAQSSKLSFLRLAPGMTLISCSGAIGRTSYARGDMEGVLSSQDVMKVVPDPAHVPPGYVYAYLSSKFGVPLVLGGTYGAIIQHIEPEHIADLPVPRFGEKLETETHHLVEEAAKLRTQAQALLTSATDSLLLKANLEECPPERWHNLGPDLAFTATPGVGLILRALPHAPRVQKILSQLKATTSMQLGRICNGGQLGTGVRFKRIDCEPEHGVRLVGQREGFWLTPSGRWISAARAPKDIFAVDETVMIASSGTLGENEVYCRPIFITGSWLKHAYTQHFFRVVSGDPCVPGAYLFAFLRSDLAFRCLRSMSTGSKQQELHRDLVARFPIPVLPQSDIEHISGKVREAFRMRERADTQEARAISVVERAIESRAI